MPHLKTAGSVTDHAFAVTDDVIYLDYHATTPCDPRVVEVIARCLQEIYGNPSSPHKLGRRARVIVEEARAVIADYIGAVPGEIVFTSGATESNNLAIKGLAERAKRSGVERHKILTSDIEHKSILKPAAALARDGFVHQTLPVSSSGRVDLDALAQMVSDQTLLISVQAANNEIGTIQPIRDISAIARRAGALFHCDAVQALGRMEINVEEWEVDLLSLSAHKAYGPKGIGSLFVRGGPEKLPVDALSLGGGQENGLRPGTLNVSAIAGFAEACRIIDDQLDQEVSRIKRLRDRFESQLLRKLEFAEIVGSRKHRLASTISVRFRGAEADALLTRLDDIAVSTGSACEAGAPEPSHVLRAVGLDRTAAYECVRVAVGRFTTKKEVDEAASRLVEAARELVALSSKRPSA